MNPGQTQNDEDRCQCPPPRYNGICEYCREWVVAIAGAANELFDSSKELREAYGRKLYTKPMKLQQAPKGRKKQRKKSKR